MNTPTTTANVNTAANTASEVRDNLKQAVAGADQAVTAVAREARGWTGRAMMTMGNSARFMWHASLGAVVTMEEKVVDTANSLAQRGAEFEDRTRQEISKRVDRASESTAGIRRQAQQRINNVEQMFDKGVNRSLHFLGVPTRQDMNHLSALIQDLTVSVNDLANKTGAMREAAREGAKEGAKEKRPTTSRPSTTA